MAGLFGGAPPVQQAQPIVEPTREDPAIEEARRKAVVAARLSRGRASTKLTGLGGSGIIGPANVARKQLLGV